MNNHEQVYHNPTRKRELIEMLKNQLEFQQRAGDVLDDKAREIFRLSSAFFGIISGLFLSFVIDSPPDLFWVGMLVTLFLYVMLVVQVLIITLPAKWSLVPGPMPKEKYSYESLLKKYLFHNSDENDYLNQLIADYVGNYDHNDADKFIDGAIQKTEIINQKKARRLSVASILLTLIILSLILLGTSVVI